MTSSPTERVRALLVAAGDRGAPTSSADVAAAAQRVWDRLGHRFGRLVGAGGIRALQDRSVSVVAARFAWMAPPQDGFDADWHALRAAFAGCAADEGVAAFEELVAALIALLGRFIGDVLVGHLLHEMWPGVFPGDPKEPL